MKIDSSMIGMESARRYTSVTKKSVSSSLVSATAGQGYDWGNESFSDLLNTGTNDEPFVNDLEKLADANNVVNRRGDYKSISSIDEKKTMQTIRERCVQFLIRWLYQSMAIGKHGAGNSEDAEVMDDYYQQYASGDYTMADASGSGTFTVNQLKMQMNYYHEETEQTSFDTVGTVRTSDGREINFNLNLSMSRSFQEAYQTESAGQFVQMTDPLVINLDTSMATLSDQKFEFDIDADGIKDSISSLNKGSGYLALDLNQDGKINDGSELFGTKKGDGFADLAQYDEDHNGWIDENDSIFNKLLVWTKNENGQDELYTLKQSGVGALCVQKAETDFSLNSLKNNQVNGKIRNTGIYLYENGNVGTMQQLDLAQ